MAFGSFIDRYGAFFRSRGHDNAPVAQRYLHGLAQAEAATFAAMATVVEDGCEQQFQHFISNAPWRHEPVIAQIGRDADRLLGGKPDSALILDESSFVKQGERSVGVARQWCGRLGKVDNCQVAVFAVLTDGARHTPVDMRLYLPQRWIEDPARCDRAEIPVQARTMRSKSGVWRLRSCVRRGRAGCGSAGLGWTAATARNPPSCARWTTWARPSSPMFMAPSGSGANRRACMFPPPTVHARPPAEQATSRVDDPSRWRSWSQVPRDDWKRCLLRDEHARSRCRSTSRTGGSGCGTARKRRRGVGI